MSSFQTKMCVALHYCFIHAQRYQQKSDSASRMLDSRTRKPCTQSSGSSLWGKQSVLTKEFDMSLSASMLFPSCCPCLPALHSWLEKEICVQVQVLKYEPAGVEISSPDKLCKRWNPSITRPTLPQTIHDERLGSLWRHVTYANTLAVWN